MPISLAYDKMAVVVGIGEVGYGWVARGMTGYEQQEKAKRRPGYR